MRNFRMLIGVVTIVVAAALLLFFRDTEFGWFRGLPLGIVLGVLGVVDLVGAARKRD